MTDALDSPKTDLALRYLKRRWRGPVDEARRGALALAEVDLDPDWGGRVRSVGVAALDALARALLALREPPGDGVPLRALAPELEGEAARAFLSVVATSLAFRGRSDEALRALVASRAAPGLPRPDAATLARLLSRARSARAARALAAADEAVAAAVAPLPPPPPGARLHLEAEPDAVERALAQALRPAKPVAWAQAGPGARRLVLLRRAGGWVTALGEGDALERELVPALARAGGVRRAAWSRFGAEPGLLVHEGARALAVEAQDEDDIAGALRGLGVLDLDPDRARPSPLRFAEALGGGPPLGVERRLRKHGMRPLAFS